MSKDNGKKDDGFSFDNVLDSVGGLADTFLRYEQMRGNQRIAEIQATQNQQFQAAPLPSQQATPASTAGGYRLQMPKPSTLVGLGLLAVAGFIALKDKKG